MAVDFRILVRILVVAIKTRIRLIPSHGSVGYLGTVSDECRVSLKESDYEPTSFGSGALRIANHSLFRPSSRRLMYLGMPSLTSDAGLPGVDVPLAPLIPVPVNTSTHKKGSRDETDDRCDHDCQYYTIHSGDE